MVSSLLYFNLKVSSARLYKRNLETKKSDLLHAAGSEALEFSYFKWLRPEVIYTSLLPDYEEFPRGLFLACRLLIFFFILSFEVSLVILFLISSFQWNCNCMCVSVNIPRHRFRLAGYRNSKNLAFEALLEMISVSGSIFITENGYFCVLVLCFFVVVTFAACSTLSLPFAVSKIKKK